MATKPKQIIAMSAAVEITAAQADGEKKAPPKFVSTFYTGGALQVAGYDLPVVIDLAGLAASKVLVANLDHDQSKRVGNFAVANDGRSLVASGTASARTAARDEVIGSAEDGYQWQASLEVNPQKIESVKAGKTVEVNGQTFKGPLYVTRAGVLKGFAFVSHGADDNTTATIAAAAASTKGSKTMKAECKQWIEAMGFDVEDLTADQLTNLEANYDGRNGKPIKAADSSSPFEKRKLEAARKREISEIADRQIELRGSDEEEISAIAAMAEHAIEAKMSTKDFRIELYESLSIPQSRIVQATGTRDRRISNAVIEAAICQAGRLADVEKKFDDQTLQLAHDHFKGRIGLKQLFHVCAEANGHRSQYSSDVTLEVQRAAFSGKENRQIHATGFSGLDISTILSNTANKFIMRGWNAVDQTPLRIARIQPVRDFKTITTVSLTDSVRYEQVGNDGQIKHGTLGEITYTNKADTYAKMLAITRTDIINDDLGALTDVPQKLGNGAMKLLNHIFWTEFLGGVGTSFFAGGNSNLLDGVATVTLAGLTRADTLFMNQTNPDGTPLGLMPAIMIVPTALKTTALQLMTSEKIKGDADEPDGNVWRGRFRVESSPYISNSAYTGNTTAGWWLIADPQELPLIAIAALNGRVEPTVETADADFNVLGVQMRGYSDVGVNFQEYRAGIYADGGTS
jgi:hypothetical protein